MVEDEDGIVIYDESDDYDPAEGDDVEEDESAESEEGFRLMTNKEIFTEEYMEEYARKMDAKIAKEKRTDRLISVGVILAIILITSLFIFINFKGLL